MSEANVLGITLAIGITAGAVVWEWLRGDLFPRLCFQRNRERDGLIVALTERLDRLERQLGVA